MNFLDRAIADGHAEISGEGKQRKILYVAVNQSERYAEPEEQVRAEFWAELIYRYGYEPARIGVEITVPDRTPSDRADLVVFRDDQRKKPYAVIECKADGVTDAEFNQNPAVRMAAKRHRRHKTKGLGRVDRCGLVHLSGERKSPIRVSISAPFVLFYGKSVAVFRVNTSVGTVRRAVRARKAGAIIPAALPPGTSQRDVPTTDGRAQALEREANIIADLPRIYGKERRKAQGQTLNAKMNFVRTVSAFSLQPSAFPSPVQPVSKEALITRSRK